MGKYKYIVKQGQSLNCWRRTELKKTAFISPTTTFDAPVNMTEGYQEVEYPVRKNFLENLVPAEYPQDSVFSELYVGFDNPRADFSTFQATPHKLSTYLQANINTQNNRQEKIKFKLITCGRCVVWINGKEVIDFAPYTRNHGTEIEFEAVVNPGENDLVLYMDDLAERDVNFFIELELLSDLEIEASMPLPYESQALESAIQDLSGLYFEKDYYNTGEIAILTDSDSLENLLLTYEEVNFSEEGSGNLTDFSRSDQRLTKDNGKFVIGNVAEIAASGLTHIYLGCQLPNQSYLYKKLVFSLYQLDALGSSLGDTLTERKVTALKKFAELDLADMNSALADIYLTKKLSETSWGKLQGAFEMISDRGDCADFMFAPLLSFSVQNKVWLPDKFERKIHQLALEFRYWIDEPGNDVMWYFSENHSLLFHTCQYLAGHLYQAEVFENSGRLGELQKKIGKERLVEWFSQFEKVGFSEWNSTTYLPIDLIGFFSLLNAAPDEEIKEMAQKALDFTFKIIAINHHSGTLSSTFGRTYEHDLKAMRIGEISNILEIAWGAGYFNYALRASTLFCLSDYQPENAVEQYLNCADQTYLTANYLQGENKVETYLFKCEEYSIASCIHYHANKKGHQQHVMNVSLGNDGTQLWINNPGEHMHSGENRPSYWAGNGIMPDIQQHRNVMKMSYNLVQAKVHYVHLYLPYWDLEEINQDHAEWLFIKKDHSYLAVHFQNGYHLENKGDTRGREIISLGLKQDILIKCGSANEFGTFSHFAETLLDAAQDRKSFNDPQWGLIDWDLIDRAPTYLVQPNLIKKEGIDNVLLKEK